MKIITLLIATFCSIAIGYSQGIYEQSFDNKNEIIDTNWVKYPNIKNYKDGITGQAIMLGRDAANIAAYIDIDLFAQEREQTLSFWFRTIKQKGHFNLFKLYSDTSSLIKDSIFTLIAKDNILYFKEAGGITDSLKINPALWYFCYLQKHQDYLEIRISSKGINKFYSMDYDFTMANYNASMGKNSLSENAAFLLDELSLYNFNEPFSKVREKKYTSKLLSIKVKPKAAQESFQGRSNNLQDSLYIGSNSIILEVWDNDQVDNDKISIYLNNKLLKKGISLAKQKKRIEVEFSSDTINEVLFYVEDMGNISEYNTAAVQLIGRNVENKVYVLSFDTQQNAVIKVVHDPAFRPASKTFQKPHQSLPSIRTKQQDVYISFSDYSIKDKDVIAFKVNDDSFTNLQLEKNPIGFKYSLSPGENELIIQAEDTKLFSCTPMIDLSTAQGNAMGNPIKLKINKKQSYLLPIKFDAPPSTKDTLKVKEEQLVFKILDPSSNDGDIVSVLQDSKLIVDNHRLSQVPLELVVKIDPDKNNEFMFRSDSTGRHGGNSCRIEIYDPKSSYKIAEFMLTSYARENPAILIIQKNN
ncbi:MAG: hypothetical protein MI974_01320 [Chitinophagales bacterium]|nr:hypothetical protein [Chitinophagales bacterium]